jgi:hypothetical protein
VSIARSAFDGEAFGFPYWRVGDLDGLEADLEPILATPGPLAIDAKRPAEDVDGAKRLVDAGFRKICMQLVLVAPAVPSDDGVAVTAGLPASPELVLAHARNFRFDRFSLDPRLPAAGRVELYRRWIGNTFANLHIAHDGGDFCSFKLRDGRVVIDLLSVLHPRRGVGRRVVRGVLGAAARLGSPTVEVVTECENRPAWRLYVGEGFAVDRYVQVFHYVRP